MGVITAKALKPFYGTDEGKVEVGQKVQLEVGYARDLERNGLVEIDSKAKETEAEAKTTDTQTITSLPTKDKPVEPDEKAKRPPHDKMNPAPLNKSA